MNIPLAAPDALAEQSFLTDLWGKLARQKWLVMGIGVTLTLLLAVAIQLLPKSYQAIATVEADAQTSQALPGYAMLRDQQFSDYTLGSELTILGSQELLGSVVRKLNLETDPDFNGSLNPSLRRKLQAVLEGWLADLFPHARPPSIDVKDKRLAETLYGLLKAVKFEPIPRSRDIKIIVTSSDNRKAALIANTIADFYLTNHMDYAQQITARAHTYVDGNLAKLREDAVAKTQMVAKYKVDHGIVTGREATLLQEQISQVSTDLNVAKAQLAALQGRAGAATNNRNNPEALAAVLGSPTIQKLREQQAAIESQRAGLASAYTSNAPALGRLNAQANDIAGRIKAEAQRMVASLQSDIQAQTASVAALTGRLGELRLQVDSLTQAQASLVTLQQDADAANEMFRASATAMRQTDASMLLPAASVRIVSHAGTPIYPSFPDNLIMLPASMVLSFGIGGMIGWVRESRRKGVVSMNQVETSLQIETLGMIPLHTKHTDLLYHDAIEQLFNRVWYMEPRPKSILVTSARPEEGKTTTAWALAEVAAARELKVCLIDADMRSTRLVSRNVQTVGLCDVLRGHATIDEVVTTRRGSNLMVMPSGHARGMPTRLLSLDRFDEVLKQMTTRYDLVIIDAPPAFIGGDCWVLSKKVDKTIFIAKWGTTTTPDIEEAIRKQLDPRTLAGIVLNMVNPRLNRQYGHTDAIYLAPEMLKYYSRPPK